MSISHWISSLGYNPLTETTHPLSVSFAFWESPSEWRSNLLIPSLAVFNLLLNLFCAMHTVLFISEISILFFFPLGFHLSPAFFHLVFYIFFILLSTVTWKSVSVNPHLWSCGSFCIVCCVCCVFLRWGFLHLCLLGFCCVPVLYLQISVGLFCSLSTIIVI